MFGFACGVGCCSNCAFGCASVCASGGASSSKYKVVLSIDTDITCVFFGARLHAVFCLFGSLYPQPYLLFLAFQLLVSQHLMQQLYSQSIYMFTIKLLLSSFPLFGNIQYARII